MAGIRMIDTAMHALRRISTTPRRTALARPQVDTAARLAALEHSSVSQNIAALLHASHAETAARSVSTATRTELGIRELARDHGFGGSERRRYELAL